MCPYKATSLYEYGLQKSSTYQKKPLKNDGLNY